MKASIATIAAFALAFAAAPAAGDDKPHAQQDKFTQCAHDSKGLKGDERHKFMSDCLKGHGEKDEHPAKAQRTHEAAHHDTPQQSRMKSCNDEAGKKNLHGDERRAFMSACLKA
jgi:hypothetical protein